MPRPVLGLPAHDPGAARQARHRQAAPTQLSTRLGRDSRSASPPASPRFRLSRAGIAKLRKMFCRHPESAAGCRGGGDHHGVGSATRQDQTCFPVEDKAKVAPSWGAVLSVQQRRVHLLSFSTRIQCFYVNNATVAGSSGGKSEQWTSYNHLYHSSNLSAPLHLLPLSSLGKS